MDFSADTIAPPAIFALVLAFSLKTGEVLLARWRERSKMSDELQLMDSKGQRDFVQQLSDDRRQLRDRLDEIERQYRRDRSELEDKVVSAERRERECMRQLDECRWRISNLETILLGLSRKLGVDINETGGSIEDMGKRALRRHDVDKPESDN